MRTKVIIHLDRFEGNFKAVKTRIGLDSPEKGSRRICVPVKADAYGHGSLGIARKSLEIGANCLGVTTTTEGTELRKGGIKAPILLFSQPHAAEIPEIASSGLIPFISDTWFADALNKQASVEKTKLSVHLKIDTGMGRIGCLPEESLALARHITDCPWLKLEGTATHFAVSDSADDGDRAYTQWQLKRFNDAISTIRDANIDPGIVHAANSGAVILHPDTWFDMVRPGLLLYGYKAVEENEIPAFPLEPIRVQPVMELISTVILIKKVKKGESVSYGRIWTAARDTFIGVLPVGYADGLPRPVSGNWQVMINGKTYPLAGRICMDLCCVELGTNSDVKRWDQALI
ncbi:MAG: alanine racemase, partial [Treponema sp.]|nr:alanine racemase [Treponema sp.]